MNKWLYIWNAFEYGRSWKTSPDCSGYAACSLCICVLAQHLNGKRAARLKKPNSVSLQKKNLIVCMPN